MGFSQAIGFLKSIAKAPINGAQEVGYDSVNPGVNAWASIKGKTMVFGVNASKRDFLTMRGSFSILLSWAPARRILIWPSSIARCLHVIRRLPSGMRDGPLESKASRER